MAVKLKPVLRTVMLGALLLAAGSWGWDWWTSARFEARTDDAYVTGDITAIAPRVSGHVVELLASDNVPVQTGDVLFRIDDRNYRAAVAQAEAAVAQAEAAIVTLASQRRVQEAAGEQAVANIAEIQASVELAKVTFQRANNLVASRAVSVASVDEARSELGQREAKLRSARAAHTAAHRQLDFLDSQRESAAATLAVAQAALDAARIDLDSTTVRAPVNGVVGNRGVQVGRFVQAGTRMLAIVRMHELWVEANLRETQIGQVTPGQAVRLSVDGFPGARIEGVVDSVSPGSGAVFSLIPPDNATGNFVRIVQRVPVKIRLTEVPENVRLVPGLSARAAIWTGQQPKTDTMEPVVGLAASSTDVDRGSAR